MKKTTISIIAVLLTVLFNQTFAGVGHDSVGVEAPLNITTLVINADVTVVLVDNNDASLEANGDKSFNKNIRLRKSGDTLLITSLRQRDFYAGTIYVPANQLRKIHINSKAHVQSLFALQIPKLDVVINGACIFNVANIGDVNVIETDNYSFEKSTEVRRLPASFHRRKE